MIYLLWECIVFHRDEDPLFIELLDSFTHLKYNLPVFWTAHTHTHTSNPMSYRDTSPSLVKMDPEHRSSHPVNCLRNHLISWVFDKKKKKLWFCPKPFCLVWHIRDSLNILKCLAFGAEFHPEPDTLAHTHISRLQQARLGWIPRRHICVHTSWVWFEDVWLMPHMQPFKKTFLAHIHVRFLALRAKRKI